MFPSTPVVCRALVILLGLSAGALRAADALRLTSPDDRLTVRAWITAEGDARYAVERDGRPVLQDSKLGLVRDDADLASALNLIGVSPVETVDDAYELLAGKRRQIRYQAKRQILTLRSEDGVVMDVIWQVSNDGVAFRYRFPAAPTRGCAHVTAERTSFAFSADSRAWLQPMSVAKTSWKRTNPSYEEYYEKDIAVGTPSPLAGWVFPALFRTGDTWVLLSEGALGRGDAGARLAATSPRGDYSIGLADPVETFDHGESRPIIEGAGRALPWRLVVVGSLATVVESTLGTDVAPAPTRNWGGATPITPGKAAWSWPLLGDNQTTFPVQQAFVDYAARMGWRYCLVDALWDTQIGWDKMAELVRYGRAKGVEILVWYNSNGTWNDAPQTPRHKLLTAESRRAEFARLKEIGIAGVKIDFFGGDGSSMIGYYLDLLEAAGDAGLLVNFHGATLPRGWQRTYPWLLTAEAIRGEEFITFEQANADQQPTHVAMLPFTRNVFDPMDFTPVVLDRLPRTQRRTTAGAELASAVLLTSGLQHYAEIPAGIAKTPDYVQTTLRAVPCLWEDVRFLDGFPGHHAVLARRGRDAGADGEATWWVAGINADDTPRSWTLDLAGLTGRSGGQAELIGDGATGATAADGWRHETVRWAPGEACTVTVPAHGGFVLRVAR